LQQIRDLETLPGVSAAEGRVVETVPFLADEDNGRAKVTVVTARPENDGVNRLRLEEGRLLEKGSREVLVIRQFALVRDLHPGDGIALQIDGQAMDFTVAGVVSSPEFIYLADPDQGLLPDNANYGVVYMEAGTGQQILGYPGSYNDIQMTEAAGLRASERDALVEAIDERLEAYGGRGAVKRANQFSNAMMTSEIQQLNVMAAAMPILFLLISALILAMMLGRMVKRDRQSIGVMKGLGYSAAQVTLHYVKYSLLVAAAGGIAGVLAGGALADLLLDYYMEFYYLPGGGQGAHTRYRIAAFLLACLFCTGAGLWGARGVARVSPADSMTAEAPKPGKRIFLERVRFVWKYLSFSNKMAMKNVFRNKKRTGFILSGVLVTFAVMTLAITMPRMISDMAGDGLREFQPMDYNVSFRAPLPEAVIREIPGIVDGVTDIEGKIEYPFRLSSGPREQALSVIGVERGTVFYHFRTQAGETLEIPENGLLLSDYAAKKLRVGVGDFVLLHSYLSDQDDRWIEVSGVVYQAMGVGAYMDRDFLAKAYLDPGVVTGFYMNAGDPLTESRLLDLPAVSAVFSLAATQDVFQQYTAMTNATIVLMVALSGVLGFAIVYNATLISIGERETEFSSLRVLGFSRGEIFRLILKENNVITAGGLLAGVPLANLFLRYSSEVFSTEQYTMRLQAGPAEYLTGMGATLLFIVLAQIATYRKIQKLDFMAALKNRV
jgi:putative ABC transport system permease protein